MNYWIGYTLVLFLGIVTIIGLILVVHRRDNSPRFKKFIENSSMVLLSLFLTFMAAEFFFKVFFAQTENRNFTLASKNWFERYWSYNSMGYRDVEWSEEALRTKRKILVSGDSFAAGQGIENIEDRFSNLLGKKLDNDYLVMNTAHPGYSTKEEIDRLRNFPYKPEILILQYFINDIRHAAEERHVINRFNTEPWPPLQPLVDHSYALNFIYWRGVLLGPSSWQGDSMAWLKMVFNDPEIWWIHQQELQTIYQGAASEQVKLIVVVFPVLTNIEQSREMTDKVVNWYREKNVPVLDVAELIQDVPTEQLVVSNVDSHPGEWLHARVADVLYEMVLQLE